MASIGKLVTHLVVDSSQFDSVLGSSQKLVGGFSKFVKRSMQAGVVAGFAAAGVAVVTLKTQLESLDEVAKLATRTGFDPATIAAFGFAAEQSGSSVAVASDSLDKFVRRLGEAAGGSGPAKKALDAMNVPLDDLLKMRPDKQLLEVADAIAQLPSEAERANAAYQLFGRSGQELVNVLALGATGIKDFMDEAEGLSLGFSAKELKNIENANDSINRLKRGIGAIGAEFTVAMAPALTEAFTQMRADLDRFSEWMRPKWDGIKEIGVGAWNAISAAANAAGTIFEGTIKKLSSAKSFDQFATAAVRGLATVEGAFTTLTSSVKLFQVNLEMSLEVLKDMPKNQARLMAGLGPAFNERLLELQLRAQQLAGKAANGIDEVVSKRMKELAASRLRDFGGIGGKPPRQAPPQPPKLPDLDVDGMIGALRGGLGGVAEMLAKQFPDSAQMLGPPEDIVSTNAVGEMKPEAAPQFAGAIERGSEEAMKLLAMQIGGGNTPEKHLTETKKQTKMLKGIWDNSNRREEPVIFQAEGAVA